VRGLRCFDGRGCTTTRLEVCGFSVARVGFRYEAWEYGAWLLEFLLANVLGFPALWERWFGVMHFWRFQGGHGSEHASLKFYAPSQIILYVFNGYILLERHNLC